MLNENLVASLLVVLSLLAFLVGADDGGLIKIIVSAYLGFLMGKRKPSG